MKVVTVKASMIFFYFVKKKKKGVSNHSLNKYKTILPKSRVTHNVKYTFQTASMTS